MSSCYESWKTAKTGEKVPCYVGEKPASSLYNPTKEAEQFAQMVEEGFTVIVGYTSGIHVQKVKERFPNNKIIVVEKNSQSIDFLKSQYSVEISTDYILCTIDMLELTLLNSYYPPLDGNFSLYPVRSWVDVNGDDFSSIKSIVKSTLEKISLDISVQAHFGKLWHRNIFQNLQICEQCGDNNLIDFYNTTFPINKTAFIAGAGPSLETSYSNLHSNRNKYFIIATDTAYSSLREQGIMCDVVISVDAQHISYSHYMGEKEASTIFAFDLCANSIAPKSIMDKGGLLCYFKSEHPLCSYISNWYEEATSKSFFPTFSSSAGTVTLAALNFANQAGFTKIESAGCDFAYLQGKMYAKGIYMDRIFDACSTKLCTTQNLFSSIMFRTELVSVGGEKTTHLLQNYKKHFDDFFATRNVVSKNFATDFVPHKQSCTFPAEGFVEHYCDELKKLIQNPNANDKKALAVTLLPYISWFAMHFPEDLKTTKIYEIGLNATIHK